MEPGHRITILRTSHAAVTEHGSLACLRPQPVVQPMWSVAS
jgi:hypothetical protein